MVCIYKITSPSGKVYIGQTRNYKVRLKQYRFINCKTQIWIFNSLRKYGFNSHVFSILHELPKDIDQGVIDQYEKLYISSYKEAGIQLLNISSGGNGKGRHSIETRAKISRSNKGRKRTVKSKPLSEDQKRELRERALELWERGILGIKGHSDETKEKLRLLNTGRKHSDETRRKLSESHKGEKHNNYGKRMPESTRIKISKANIGRPGSMKGKKFSEDHKNKISEAKRGKYNGKVGEDKENAKLTNEQAKEVFNSELSSRKLAKIYHVNKSTILRIKSGKYWKQVNNIAS